MEAYGYLKDGQIVAPVAMCSRFNDIGAWHTLSDEERMIHGWYPCEVIETPFNPNYQIMGQTTKSIVDNKIVLETLVFNKSLESVKEEFLLKIANEVQLFLDQPIVFLNNYFKLSSLPYFHTLISEQSECFFIQSHKGLVKLSSLDLRDLISKLISYDQAIKCLQFQAQEQIKNALTVEEIISVSVYEELLKLLEN